jgi:UDP-N-acetylmuramate dehydrogenase
MERRRPGFSRKFLDLVGAPVREAVPLRDFSNFRIGGPADFFFEASTTAGLRAAIRAARESGIPFYVMGGGFNLLFDDAGFRGLMIRMALAGLELQPDGVCVKAAAGIPLEDLVRFAAGHGLAGLEFLAGIPGSVGGAVFGNAGAFGRAVSDCFDGALLMRRNGPEFRISRDQMTFAYRHSGLKVRHEILLEAEFRLAAGDRDAVLAKIEDNLAVRETKHPPRDTAYAGSFFKNFVRPDGTKEPAGLLLDKAGARGMRVGGAAVSDCHCNFLINEGHAAARDVLALAARLKTRVKDRFGIELEEEVIFLPADAPGL